GVVAEAEAGVVLESAPPDPARLAGGDRPDAMRRTRLHDRLPELVAAGGIGEEDLVADLAGPAGAADDDRNTGNGRVQGPVVLHVEDGLTHQVPHHLPGLRPLHPDRLG